MKKVFIIHYKEPDFNAFLFGSLFGLFAIVLLLVSVIQGSWLGFLLVIGLFVRVFFMLQSEGVALNFDTMKFRRFKSFFSVRVGDWEVLPPITNVLYYAFVDRTPLEDSDSWGTWAPIAQARAIYKVSLFNTDSNFSLLVCTTNDERGAFQLAQDLADCCGVALEEDRRF